MAKTTLKQYKEFQRSFKYWQKKLGLIHYRVLFRWGCSNGNYAQINVNITCRTAVVKFAKTIPDKQDYEDCNPTLSGKHEAIHLLLAELRYIAHARYIHEEDVEAAEEAIVATLENVLKED